MFTCTKHPSPRAKWCVQARTLRPYSLRGLRLEASLSRDNCGDGAFDPGAGGGGVGLVFDQVFVARMGHDLHGGAEFVQA